MTRKFSANKTSFSTAAISVATALWLGTITPVAVASEKASGHGGMKHQASMAQMDEVQVMGKVKKTYAGKPMIKLQHDPVPAWSWPTMTMNFVVADGVDLSGYEKGQSVHFTLKKKDDGSYVITEMMPMGGSSKNAMPGMKH